MSIRSLLRSVLVSAVLLNSAIMSGWAGEYREYHPLVLHSTPHIDTPHIDTFHDRTSDLLLQSRQDDLLIQQQDQLRLDEIIRMPVEIPLHANDR